MNLIEQLGYEYAKEIYLSNLEDFSGNASGATISTEKLRFTHEELEKALLEYRRQHNKYEVDDLVVFSNEKLMKPVLLKIKEFRHFNLVRLEVLDSGLCGPSYQTDIRHATDAEIEAGKRLEVV